MFRNYLTIFLSILSSFPCGQEFLNQTKMSYDRHQVNDDSPRLEVISLLSSLAQKNKKWYWVRNIAKLGKNSLTREITWTSCYISWAEPLNIMFVTLMRVQYISSDLIIHGFWNPLTSLNFDNLKKFWRTSMKICLNISDCRPVDPFKTGLGSDHVVTA